MFGNSKPLTSRKKGLPLPGHPRTHRAGGPTVLAIDENSNAVLTAPGKPDGRIALIRRNLPMCLAEELRRLDADDIYALALAGAAEVETVERATVGRISE